MAKGAQMNTRGPKGGQGNNNESSVSGSTSRTTGYAQRAGRDRGDQKQIASRNLQGQKTQSKQAAVNRGPFTDFSVSGQNLSRTKPPMPKYNKNAAQPRAMQNSMKGKGTPAG